MLEQLLRWMAAGDAAILANGPVFAIAIALLGGAGITQVLKFLVIELVPDRWETWSIRLVAIGATYALLHWLTDFRLALALAIAFIQPYAYSAVMAIVRHRWPWLEATRSVGSARPSEASQAALEQRRGG